MKFLSWKVAMLCFMLAFIFAFTYRICEQHGLEARQACFWAIWLNAVAGLLGLIPASLVSESGSYAFFIAVVVGAAMRIVVTAIGIILIILLLDPNREWFLSVAGGFYAVILVIETVFGVKVLRKLQLKDQEIALEDGPVVSEYESA